MLSWLSHLVRWRRRQKPSWYRPGKQGDTLRRRRLGCNRRQEGGGIVDKIGGQNNRTVVVVVVAIVIAGAVVAIISGISAVIIHSRRRGDTCSGRGLRLAIHGARSNIRWYDGVSCRSFVVFVFSNRMNQISIVPSKKENGKMSSYIWSYCRRKIQLRYNVVRIGVWYLSISLWLEENE